VHVEKKCFRKPGRLRQQINAGGTLLPSPSYCTVLTVFHLLLLIILLPPSTHPGKFTRAKPCNEPPNQFPPLHIRGMRGGVGEWESRVELSVTYVAVTLGTGGEFKE